MVFLYVIILTAGTSSDLTHRFKFPSYEACKQAITKTKIDNKKESTVVMFCATEENHRHYNGVWWKDSVKDN